MTKKRKIIQIPRGTVDQIAKANNCSKVMVYNALRYATDSAAAQKIRREALELYGGIVTSKIVFEY